MLQQSLPGAVERPVVRVGRSQGKCGLRTADCGINVGGVAVTFVMRTSCLFVRSPLTVACRVAVVRGVLRRRGDLRRVEAVGLLLYGGEQVGRGAADLGGSEPSSGDVGVGDACR